MTELDIIKTAVRDVMQEEMKAFFIDREEHYQHHQFIKGLKTGIEGCQSLVGRITLITIIGGIATVLVLGVVAWIRKQVGLG
jgi:predicted Rdx family selenoprotein